MADGYSKLKWVEFENFMGYSKARVEMDETNILNFKGYNGSGKSAIKVGLDVAFFDRHPHKQIKFIKDDEEYFRIMVGFDDGVVLLRDKYINGKSLYELYKYDDLLFSTKEDDFLQKVQGVPEPIQQYLGLVEEGGQILNSRTCFEPQLLAQTTGRENYTLLNKVLKTEEITRAGALLDKDKSEIKSKIDSLDSKKILLEEEIAGAEGFTQELITGLEDFDKNLDHNEHKSSVLASCSSTVERIKEIKIPPYLETIDFKALDDMVRIDSVNNQLTGIKVNPRIDFMFDVEQFSILNNIEKYSRELTELKDGLNPYIDRSLDTERLSLISSLDRVLKDVEKISVAPEVKKIDVSRLELLKGIEKVVESYTSHEKTISNLDSQIGELKDQRGELDTKIKEVSNDFIICDECGNVIEKEVDGCHQ